MADQDSQAISKKHIPIEPLGLVTTNSRSSFGR